MEKHAFKSAFIALIGRPNSGKSTLMNAIIGENLSIVTSVPQTTRRNIKGIYSCESMQLVFVDTPGIHEGKHAFNKFMVQESTSVLKSGEVDLLCYLVDLARPFGEEEDFIAGIISTVSLPIFVFFTKMDLCSRYSEKIEEFHQRYPGLRKVPGLPINATGSKAKSVFLDLLQPYVPEGPAYYPAEDLTDENLRFFAGEYLRKHIIHRTIREVPHATFVEIESYTELENRHKIEATIHVETKGQRGIIIGPGGKQIDRIRKATERDMYQLTGMRASLKCHVKVTPKWRQDSRFLREMGYEPVSKNGKSYQTR
ncbi:MAG: GTPase Era [Chitinivibrionales bacterium]|nr:GTPase Era [Chitinivibrionales bacterium]